jgi:methanogenic corrinoid protein MtbC1
VTSVSDGREADDGGYRQYLDALLAGDRRRCREIFENWLAADTDLRTLYEERLQRSLYDVGERWERGQISVAAEHLATAITDSLLNLVYPRLFGRPHSGRSAVISCAANEYHQIGGKMVADWFELHGWRGYFLGANTPLRDLLDLIRDKRPAAVALSLTVYFQLDSLIATAVAIRSEFPGVPVLAGGQAFRWGGRERVERIPGVCYLASLTELDAWIRFRGSDVY